MVLPLVGCFNSGFAEPEPCRHHKLLNASRPEGRGIRSISEPERVLVPRNGCLHICLSSRNRVAQMHGVRKQKKQRIASRVKGRPRRRQQRLKSESVSHSQIWIEACAHRAIHVGICTASPCLGGRPTVALQPLGPHNVEHSQKRV